MATITLKNVPDDLYERLRQSAEANRRSINNEAITCLERMLRIQRPSSDRVEAEVRRIHEMLGDRKWTMNEINEAIDRGHR